MPGTTPNLGLYLPGGGSTGTWIPDETADIDPINQNFVDIDEWAGVIGNNSNRVINYYGPAASIGAVTPKDGDTYQESDGNKILWRREGGVWVTAAQGLYLIRPATVSGTGAAINADGSVDPGTGTSIRINGVFSSRFDEYKILCYMTIGSAGGNAFEFADGSSVLTAANSYVHGGLGVNNSTTVTGYSNGGTATQIPLTPGVANQHEIEIRVSQPFSSTKRKLLKIEAYCQNVNSQAYIFSGGGGTVGTATPFDGFRINPATAITGGRIAVYGVK